MRFAFAGIDFLGDVFEALIGPVVPPAQPYPGAVGNRGYVATLTPKELAVEAMGGFETLP